MRRFRQPRPGHGTGRGATAALPRAVAGLCLGLAAGLVVALPGSGAAAVTRDVEVTTTDDADGRLTLVPAVVLLEAGPGSVAWPVGVRNGGTEALTIDLAVRPATAGAPGAPSGDDTQIVPGPGEVDWAELPRTVLEVPAGARADLDVLLRPDTGDLPDVLALVATARTDPPVTVVATAVVVPEGHQPEVTVLLDRDGATLTSTNGPAVVDVALLGTAPLRSAVEATVGPLVLLDDEPRRLDFRAPSSVLGNGRTEVVVASDGVELARTSLGTSSPVGRLLLVAVAVALVLVAAVLTFRRLRP